MMRTASHDPRSARPTARRTLALLAGVLLVAAGCGGQGAERASVESFDAATGSAGPAPAPPPPPDRAAYSVSKAVAGQGAQARDAAGSAPAAPAAPAGVAAQPGSPTATSMLIRTGAAVVEVEDVDRGITALRQLAARLGGYVANSTLQGGAEQVRSATLELKIPAPRFDEAVSGLTPLGDVEHVSVSAEDVGEEFTDLTARVENARRLEERLVRILAERTGKLEEVLAVERELARVREQIERHEGRLRYLSTRVATSTLTVTVHEPYPLVGGRPGASPIADAFRQAWRNFVGFVAGFIASLGVLVPLALILAVVVWAWRRFLGWRLPRRSRPDAPPPAAAG